MKPETYIRKYSMTVPVKELARRLGRSSTYVAGVQERLGCKPPKRIRDGFAKASRFKPGSVPKNKGKKMPASVRRKVAKTFFKSGHLPHNTRRDGDISIRMDKRKVKCKFIRTALGVWTPYHVYRWQMFRGPVPKGMIIRFRDGNPLNCKLDNLELIDRAEHAIRNRWGSRELLETRKIIKQLNKTIHEKQNQRSQRSPLRSAGATQQRRTPRRGSDL